MALGKNIKMYLMLFVATTCVYMVLYQYNINNRDSMPSPELMKNKLMSAEAARQAGNARIATSSLVKRYNIFLWSPLSLMTSHSSPSSSSSASSSTPKMLPAPSLAVASLSTSPPASSSLLLLPSPTSTSSLSSPISLTPLSSSASASASLPATASSAPSSLLAAPLLGNTNNKKSAATALASNKTSTPHSVAPLGSISSDRNITNTTKTTTLLIKTTKLLNNSINNEININKNNKNTQAITTTTTTTTRTRTTTKIAFAAALAPPPLYIITPTYKRPEQAAELTRLGYTLKHVVNLLWLVIEDANKTSPLVTNTLNRIGVPYEYLVAPMPEEYKNTKKAKPRGVSNRNRGLQWLRQNATDGVFYFADDDNTYDILIFEQMRYTKKVSMWPVGLVTKFGVSSPIIRKGKIDGFYDGWIGGRKYPVDMAGFAVSVKFLHDRPNAKMPFKPGYEEDGFLKSLAPLNNTEIELLASECTEILTWHTQTKKNLAAQQLNMTKYGDTNLVRIDKNLIRT